MTQEIQNTLFKYLTAFQLVVLIFTVFMQMYEFDEDREVLIGVSLIALAAFVYKKDKDNKVELGNSIVTPIEEMTIKKAISLIEEAFGIRDVDAQTIEMLKQKIATLEAGVNKT